MKESADFTPWLKRLIEADGGIVIPFVAGFVMTAPKHGKLLTHQSGWPDRLVWHRGWHGFIEVKVDDHQLTPRQRYNIQELCRRRPGSAVVVRGFSDGSSPRVESHDGTIYGWFQHVEDLFTILKDTNHGTDADSGSDS